MVNRWIESTIAGAALGRVQRSVSVSVHAAQRMLLSTSMVLFAFSFQSTEARPGFGSKDILLFLLFRFGSDETILRT